MLSSRRLALTAGAATILFTLGLTNTASAGAAAAGDRVVLAAVEYQISVVTSDIENAGTDATVEVRLNGTSGSSNFMILDSAKDNFERNSTDTFIRPLSDLGTLESVDVHFIRGGGDSATWHLAHIRVSAPDRPSKYFPAHRWIGSTQYLNIPAAVNPVTYTIRVITSDIEDAGTDSTVEVRLRGTLGSSPYFHLDNENVDNFQRNTTNTFTRVIRSLGTLVSVDVRFDPSGDSPHWHLSHITVTRNSDTESLFPRHDWFTAPMEVNLPVAV
jgi:hypothetical protein